MTVCVAAICEQTTILGASDRMLTSGDVQFQPVASKIYPLTNSIVAMVAGDMAVQSDIVAEMKFRVGTLLDQDPPPNQFRVKDIAQMYADVYAETRAKRAERDFLLPLGLTHNTFISRQKELAPELATNLATELIGKRLPSAGVIIAGVDLTGAHLYVVENGEMSCHDAAGFVAMGSGWYHASSHFMFSSHDKAGTLARALLLTYSAKRRAEVAPGVGAETDMFSIRGLNNYFEIGPHVVGEMEKVYATAAEGHKAVEQTAERSAHEYVEEITRPPVQT